MLAGVSARCSRQGCAPVDAGCAGRPGARVAAEPADPGGARCARSRWRTAYPRAVAGCSPADRGRRAERRTSPGLSKTGADDHRRRVQHLPPRPRRGPACAQVDLGAIRDNVAALRAARRAGRGDGGGQGGRLRPRPAAAAPGPPCAAARPGSGVAQLAEALELRRGRHRRAGAHAGCTSRAGPRRRRSRPDIDLSVSHPWALDAVAAAARRDGVTARVHLKVDTGLGRNGACGDELARLVARRAAASRPRASSSVVGVWSHFAYADAPQHPTVRAQQERFEGVLDAGRARPACARGAAPGQLRGDPDQPLRPLRPRAAGVAVYGLSPVPGPRHARGLRAPRGDAADRRPGARSSGCPAGQGVSYGHTYTTERRRPSGPGADGLRRRHPAQCDAAWARCWSAAGACRIAGRVCMDQFVVDLGADFAGAAGDEVVLFGRRRGGRADGPGLGRGRRHDQLRDRHAGRRPGAPRRTRGREPHEPPSGQHRPRPGRRPRRCRRRNRGRRCRRTALTKSRKKALSTLTPRGGYDHTPDKELVVVADDGVPLHVEVDEPDAVAAHPDHPTVVFSHGYTLSLKSLGAPAKGAASSRLPRRAVGPAQPRPVRARAPAESCTIDQLGRDLHSVIEETAPEGRLVLIGHSMGGMTMMSLAEQFPEVVRERVVAAAFVATSAGGHEHDDARLRAAHRSLIGRLGPRFLARLGTRQQLVNTARRARSRRRGPHRRPLQLRLAGGASRRSATPAT